jgi:hypothetical protein
MENLTLASYKKAEKKVKRIKGFYCHLTVYLIVNSLILILGYGGFQYILEAYSGTDPDFTVWIIWNIFGTPLFWGIGLMIHWIRVFGPGLKFVREWEERQMRKFLEEENRYR